MCRDTTARLAKVTKATSVVKDEVFDLLPRNERTNVIHEDKVRPISCIHTSHTFNRLLRGVCGYSHACAQVEPSTWLIQICDLYR